MNLVFLGPKDPLVKEEALDLQDLLDLLASPDLVDLVDHVDHVEKLELQEHLVNKVLLVLLAHEEKQDLLAHLDLQDPQAP